MGREVYILDIVQTAIGGTMTRPVPTIYFVEKIANLNAHLDRLEVQGQHNLDQSETLTEIDSLARVIQMEAQRWMSVPDNETVTGQTKQ